MPGGDAAERHRRGGLPPDLRQRGAPGHAAEPAAPGALGRDFVPEVLKHPGFHRWTEALKPGLVKGAWSEAEDQLLIHLKASSGQKTSWGQLSQLVPGRSTKQCRERWQNFLDPALNKSKWTEVSFFRTAGFSHISWWRPQHRMLAHLIARTHPPSCQTPPRSCRRTRTLPFCFARRGRQSVAHPTPPPSYP